MILKCLNCLIKVHKDDNNTSLSFCCDNCSTENFADYFGTPMKVVYLKAIKSNGETSIFGQCINKYCSAHDIDNYTFSFEISRAEILIHGIKSANLIRDNIDCPECGTPYRLFARISPETT